MREGLILVILLLVLEILFQVLVGFLILVLIVFLLFAMLSSGSRRSVDAVVVLHSWGISDIVDAIRLVVLMGRVAGDKSTRSGSGSVAVPVVAA